MTKSDVLALIEADSKASNERVRDMIKEHDPDYLATHDAGMEEIASGRAALRSLWHSISPAQRRLVRALNEGRRSLVRSGGTRFFYDAVGEPDATARVARSASVKALVAHKVLRFETDRHDPELRAVLDVRGYALLELLRTQN